MIKFITIDYKIDHYTVYLIFLSGKCEMQLGYYKESCPRAEEIVKDEVSKLYGKHKNTAVSWVRNLFHDCMVKVILLF